ncbi:MAG: response regulator [Bosea sp. (in: a-proteobacteria)]
MQESSVQTPIAGTTPGKLRVLIADPVDRDRMSLAEALRPHKDLMDVIETQGAGETLKVLRQSRIDIAYVDLQLQGAAGTEVLGEARRENIKPFLVLTAAAVLPNWAMLATDLFAYEFLKKPCAPEDVVNAIHAFRSMRRPTSILLAESNEVARGLMRKIITASRFRCDIDETDNGRHALKMARTRNYDIALIDSGLSGMSGLETACQLQSQFEGTATVLLLPASNTVLAASLKHFNLQYTLSKPFFARDVDLLLHQVHGLRRPYLMNAIMKADKPRMTG